MGFTALGSLGSRLCVQVIGELDGPCHCVLSGVSVHFAAATSPTSEEVHLVGFDLCWAFGLGLRGRVPCKGILKGPAIRDPLGYYNIGALIIRIGFWGLLYYNHNKEPPQ